MLEFEKSILQKTIPESNLLIIANGLGLEEIIAQQLDLYLMPEALVFVINYTEMQYEYYKNRFESKYFCCENITIPEKRKLRYLKGGVVLIAQQTLLTDMINSVVDVRCISCLFVINAEKIYENDNTTFIVDYLKKYNADAIIRGFTDKCVLLNFDTAMHSLQVNKAFMFPRFEESVQNSITKEINLVEKKLKLSKEMEEIQLLILETIKGLIREIKRYDKYNKNLNEIYEDFDISKVPRLSRVINESIANYGYRSEIRKLSRDVINYTKLINLLFNVDFKFFYEVLQQLWNEQILEKEKSTWINLESGLLLMEKAIAYNNIVTNDDDITNTEIKETQKNNTGKCNDITDSLITSDTERINTETQKNNKVKCNVTTDSLITSDTETINTEIKEIQNTSKELKEITEKNDKNVYENKQKPKDDINVTKTQIDEIKNIKRYKKTKNINDNEESSGFEEQEDIFYTQKNNITKTNMKKITSIIDLLHKITGSVLILVQNETVKCYYTIMLENKNIKVSSRETKPIHNYIKTDEEVHILTYLQYSISINTYNHIILTSPNLATMRKIEVLHTKNKLFETKVYTIYYKNSLEEQNFLNEVRNETSTYKKLIEKYSRFALNIQNTETDDDKEYTVAVDFREMRCALPYFLYKAGNILQITNLETGDYILGQNTAIERKAIADFIQSINTGRLYSQAQMITYKYKNSYLLIEFIRRTCLADFYLPTEKINVLDKFVIFMFNFSRLKIIWSNSEILTTKILRNIQKKKQQK